MFNQYRYPHSECRTSTVLQFIYSKKFPSKQTMCTVLGNELINDLMHTITVYVFIGFIDNTQQKYHQMIQINTMQHVGIQLYDADDIFL